MNSIVGFNSDEVLRKSQPNPWQQKKSPFPEFVGSHKKRRHSKKKVKQKRTEMERDDVQQSEMQNMEAIHDIRNQLIA